MTTTSLKLPAGGGDPLTVLAWVRRRVINLAFAAEDASERLRVLQKAYRDRIMDFAAACGVRMSAINPRSCVRTTDSHFRIYRRKGRQTIPLLAPWQ